MDSTTAAAAAADRPAHTSGPWQICWGDHGTYPLGIRSGSLNVVTAISRPASAEAVANAHLIAAAPELLFALEEARQGLAWYQETYPEAVDGSDDEAMARIDAALAKATGRAA